MSLDDTPREEKRFAILDAARSAVTQRAEHYGRPENNFALIGEYWSVFLGVEVKPWHVPAMLVLLKIARLQGDQTHTDNWIDIAGYAACGGEVAE